MGNQGPADSAHILLVEDNPGDVELLRLAFENANLNCRITVIHDGGEAVDFIHRENAAGAKDIPDLAVLDLNVPKKDGVEILEAMRASASFASMPVVILTSSSSTRELARLQKLGIARHINKPADLEAFMAIGGIIRDILTSYRPA
jgi:two-component system response regulator